MLTRPRQTSSMGEKPNDEPTVNVFLAYGAPGVRSSSEVTGLFNTVRQTQCQSTDPSEPSVLSFSRCLLNASCVTSVTKSGKDPCLPVYILAAQRQKILANINNPKPNLQSYRKHRREQGEGKQECQGWGKEWLDIFL